MPLSSSIVETREDLALACGEWDELAVLSERPFSAPAWAMAWWDHLRPDGAALRVVLVRQGEGLAGVVPLFAHRGRLAPIGGAVAPVEPLSRPGLEREVASAAAAVLAQTPVKLVSLQLHGGSPDWGELLDRDWPGRPGLWRWVESETPLPRIDLGENGFEGWLAAKSSSFRRDLRRNRRSLEENGGTFRFATGSSLNDDVREFLRLHRARRAERGGSDLADDRVEDMLTAVGSDLISSDRFRLLCLDMDGKMIAGQLLIAAGQEVSAWNSGFDEAYAKHSPSMQCIVYALEDASVRGERTMSLGPGGHRYKDRLATEMDCLSSQVLVPFGRSYPAVRLKMFPQQFRRKLATSLSPQARARLRRLIRSSRRTPQ